MNANDIVQKAKERLAELDAEAAKLRAILAAAEGNAPAPQLPTFVPVPYIVPRVPDYVHEPLRWLRLDDVICSGGVRGQPTDFTWTIDPIGTQIGGVAAPNGTVYGPGPSIDNTIRFGSS